MHRWLLALFVCSCASAQPVLSLDAAPRDTPEPPTAVVADSLAPGATPGPVAGDKALLFQVDALSLRAYAGGFGGKWWVGSTTALTAGLQLSINESDREPVETLDGNLNRLVSARAVVGSEFHASADRFSPFVSVEAGVGRRTYTYERTRLFPDRTEVTSTVEAAWTLSGAVGVGVEYRLTDRFSLAGQQSLRAEIGRGEETRSIGEEDPIVTDINQLSLTTGGTTLVLAVYF